MHYMRMWRRGTTELLCPYKVHGNTHNDAETFWERVYKTSNCWFWIAGMTADGYGSFRDSTGVCWRAPRYSYMLIYRTIPHDMLVLHHCDTPACVNPEHLFLGGHKENRQDSYQKGQHRREAARAIRLANVVAEISST